MVLLDSVYINNSGGLILLRYLVNLLEKSNIDIFYLFDKRTENIFNHIAKEKCRFIKPSIKQRLSFYCKNRHHYHTVLCFGNLPPPIRIKAKVLVYFHQPLFLEIPNDFNFKSKLTYRAKQQVIKLTYKNADVWLLQSQLIKDKLSTKYDIDKKIIKVLPFYPPFVVGESLIKSTRRKQNRFIYVSNVAPHKNHERLIEAFCQAYNEIGKGELVLTIPSHANHIKQLISTKKAQGYPIFDIGFIDRNELGLQYLLAEYLIFPSLAESFGLGLVEAIDLGCKVIGADLSYIYQVCEPSATFNPYNVESIKQSIISTFNQVIPPTEKVIDNRIDVLLQMLENRNSYV